MGFKADMSGVAAKIRKISTNTGLGRFLASEAQSGMDKYVPMRTGQLAHSAKISPFTVEYIAPYARYPFNGYGMKFRKDKHPLATSRWDRSYASADGESLGRMGTEYVKRML